MHSPAHRVRSPTPPRSQAWRGLALAMVVALAGCPSDGDDDDATQPPEEGFVLRDVIYSGDAGSLPQTGDLFLPGGVEDPPVVVVVHGGGFVAGSRGEMELYCSHLQRNGIATFNIDYRLVNQGGAFPGSAIDTLDAVRYLRANPDGHPIGGVCATAGASAGGTLASLATLLDDEDLFTRAGWGPLRGSSDSVGPLIGIYGVWDFTSRLEQHGSVPPMEQEYLGGAPEDFPERYAFASPIHHVAGAAGPVLLLHGEQDALVEIVQSEELLVALEDAAVQVELHRYPDATHGFLQPTIDDNPDGMDAVAKSLAFLEPLCAGPDALSGLTGETRVVQAGEASFDPNGPGWSGTESYRLEDAGGAPICERSYSSSGDPPENKGSPVTLFEVTYSVTAESGDCSDAPYAPADGETWTWALDIDSRDGHTALFREVDGKGLFRWFDVEQDGVQLTFGAEQALPP